MVAPNIERRRYYYYYDRDGQVLLRYTRGERLQYRTEAKDWTVISDNDPVHDKYNKAIFLKEDYWNQLTTMSDEEVSQILESWNKER